ncbi:MAG: hypothetical protein D3917_03585 [Candidatus Electrothrix sp. AX5]|nr:hypothetical protein [Candidatus Electrothrix sp. AX5]
MKTFDCSIRESCQTIGGLGLHVSSTLDKSAGDILSLNTGPFSCVSEVVDTSADITVHIASYGQRKSYPVCEKFLSAGCAEFYRTSKGYREDLYGSSDRDLLVWSIDIDPEFSSFHCGLHHSLSQERSIVINLNELAFNPFLLKHSFLNHQGLIIHAAGGSFQGKGIVFAAPSRTGKSTLSQLLMEDRGNQLFSEERLIIRLVRGKWYVWGTPWQGEGGIALNKAAPLDALVFLRQADDTAICRSSPSVALHSLLQTASIPWYSKEWAEKGLALCESLLGDIPAYEFFFRPDDSVIHAVALLADELEKNQGGVKK